MMNGTAVLPVSQTAYTGNAAAISGGNSQIGSGSGSTSGFSDTLGKMTANGKNVGMNASTRINTDDKAILSGDVLSELSELEESAKELKELLKASELAGYLQSDSLQFYADIPKADNSELLQIISGNESADAISDTLSITLSLNDDFLNGLTANDANMAMDLQNGGIVTDNSNKIANNAFSETLTENTAGISKNANFAKSETDISSNAFVNASYNSQVSDNGNAIASKLAEDNINPSSSKAIENGSGGINGTGENSDGFKTGNSGSDILSANGAETGNSEIGAAKGIRISRYEVQGEETQEAGLQSEDIAATVFTRRNVESKSDELKAITAGKTNGTDKSDSDLEVEQKVTDKGTASEAQARGASLFARTESRFDENSGETQTVRVPISDMASFISEHTPKANGKSAMTVVLTPETLGKITVRMVNESGKLTVEILTETQAAKELLQAKSEQLAYALKNDDVELTSYKVETSQAELFQRDFDGSSKNPYRQQSHGKDRNDTDDFDSMLSEIQAMD